MLGEINVAPVDRYTLAHSAVGVLAKTMGLGAVPTFFLAVAWEFAERPLKRSYPGIFPRQTQNAVLNSVFDVGAVMVGWLVMKGLNK